MSRSAITQVQIASIAGVLGFFVLTGAAIILVQRRNTTYYIPPVHRIQGRIQPYTGGTKSQ